MNIFRVLKTTLRDAYAKGAMADDPVKGVQKPECVRGTVAISSLAYVTKALAVAGEELALEIVVMAGCGLRNGEARAVNVHNVVAQDVCQVREQIHSNTLKPAKLKHRKAGEFREVPLPRFGRRSSATWRSTAHEGRLPAARPRRLLHRGHGAAPSEEALRGSPTGGRGDGLYGFRRYFASNALGNGIPITDVAEWMGHKSIEETYRTYRDLMPGSITKAARSLDVGLWEAA
ncbi:hypothetical protein [Streptomyces sp. NPDC056045]|uniref:hypothetical protein n=1 Tax=Streptomyces sp. NPDC056045 TaxID=3345691 RepID=UPI0035DA49F3